METVLPLLMFPVLFAFLISGFPVAFTLAGTALLFACIGHGLELFYWSDLGFIPSRLWGIVQNLTLVAVPLFVFMGLTLEKSGIAEEMFSGMARMMSRQRAGLALAVVGVGTLLAASTGIVGATVVTMGVLALPSMLSRGYDRQLSCGTIAAAGTLGQIIPPSIVLVLLGDIMNVDVGDLFVGAIVPGLLLVGLYAIYVQGVAWFRPSSFPNTSHEPWKGNARDIWKLLIPLLLIIVVLGSIILGIASPTEAAACGAAGALLVAIGHKKLTRPILGRVARETATISGMVFLVLVGAQFFGVVFRGLGGDDVIADFFSDLGASPTVILLVMLAILFLLGCFLDFLEICFIVIPIIFPVLSSLGFDPLWVAILIAINLQTSFLTPPFGFALFYLKGVAPPEVSTIDIYRGVIPFVGLQILALGILILWPDLTLWLPQLLFSH